jgi:type VI protein secretion system component VasF
MNCRQMPQLLFEIASRLLRGCFDNRSTLVRENAEALREIVEAVRENAEQVLSPPRSRVEAVLAQLGKRSVVPMLFSTSVLLIQIAP